MNLPLPTDENARPYLHCQRCRRDLSFGPFFGRHPDCEHQDGDGCPLETRYHAPQMAGSDALAMGPTPLLDAGRVRARLGLPNLWLKNETCLPTWSWKDRVNRVHARLAQTWGYRRIVAVSTGNHGISLAAEARRAQLDCQILIHPDCPSFTKQLIRYFGAKVTPYTNDSYVQLSEMMAREKLYPAVSLPPMCGLGNAFGAEGYKSIAVEIAQALPMDRPTWVIVPTGIGDGVFGVAKGFGELVSGGAIEWMPRIVAVQGARCAPLVHAWKNGLDEIEPVSNPSGIALSIREPWCGGHALNAVRASQGVAIAVTDAQILDAMARLADEGLLIEPASAATVAAAGQLAQDNILGEDDTVVCILSGAGVKWAGADWLENPPI